MKWWRIGYTKVGWRKGVEPDFRKKKRSYEARKAKKKMKLEKKNNLVSPKRFSICLD